MSAEAELQNAILLRFGREPGVTMWRQNVGVCKSEVCTRAHLERLFDLFSRCMRLDATAADTGRELVRALLADNPRFTPFGLCKGSSDIVGIVERFAPEPVGLAKGVIVAPLRLGGIFIAAEVKAPEPARIKVTDEQQAFLRVVNERGGVGRVVRSEADMARLIADARSL